MLSKLRPSHWFVVAVATILALLLWFGFAYDELPRIWSHHEHKRIGSQDEIVSYTAQDILADPINLRGHGTAGEIGCALANGGCPSGQCVGAVGDEDRGQRRPATLVSRGTDQFPLPERQYPGHGIRAVPPTVKSTVETGIRSGSKAVSGTSRSA